MCSWLVHEHRIDAGLAARVARLVVAARVDPQAFQSIGVLVYLRLNVRCSVVEYGVRSTEYIVLVVRM